MSRPPARVMFLITELDPGGAERLVFELATRLDPERYRALVVALDDASGLIGDLLREAGIRTVGLGAPRRNVFSCARKLAPVIAAEKPDLVHAHLFHANIAARRALERFPGIPLISTVHIVERRFRPWHFVWDRRTAPRAFCEVCVSETVAEFQRQKTGLPGSFFRVIKNGIDLARFENIQAQEREGAASLVVAVGHLRGAQKGYDVLLAAWREVARLRPEARLWIAGEGPYRGRLERTARRAGLQKSVRFWGFVGEIPAFLAAGDVFAMPSRWEGLPLSGMEAMAAGLPVVGSDIGPLRELLGAGGTPPAAEKAGVWVYRAGLLVPPEDPAALCGALVALLRDKARRKEMGRSARQQAYRYFGIGRMITETQLLYEEALSSWPRRLASCPGGPSEGSPPPVYPP